MEILAAILAVFALALVAPLLHRLLGAATGWILALLPAAVAILLARHLPLIGAGGRVLESHAWVPTLGVHLSFNLDGLGVLFAILITGIGALIVAYAGGYLAGDRHLGRFYGFLLLFMGAMLGVVLADDVVTLFVFWELTSLSSYLLIGFRHESTLSRKAALQALLVTASGGLALLAGLLLLGGAAGTFSIHAMVAGGFDAAAHPYHAAIVLLILAGAFTKSAQFPFHFWLPNAMEAPTPVSAYLHSATMVKAGIYLLARLSPVLAASPLWGPLLVGAGGVTMLLGAGLALRQSDFKRILAYSTVSALGTITLLLGVGGETAAHAAIVFLLAHALYKGALFMVAGAVDHETGTRDVDALGGLARVMPLTAAAAILAALSLAGLAPLFSFIGKELVFEAVLSVGTGAPLLVLLIAVAAALLVAVAGIVGFRPFLGPQRPTPREPHEASPALLLGPLVLAATGLLLGLLPTLVEGRLVVPAVASILGHPAEVHLALWHGVTPALLLSLMILAAGYAIYRGWINVHRIATPLVPLARFGPARGYDLALVGLDRIARGQTLVLQNGYLRYYLLTILGVTVLAAGAVLVHRGGLPPIPTLGKVAPHEAMLAVLITSGALLVATLRSRLGAVAALGVVGYGVSLVYIVFGAPDLAMTQFLIETLTVLIFVFVLYHMPRFARISPQRARARDAVFAAAFGVLMMVLTYAALGTQPFPPISEFYGQVSYAEAHGRNVVNVILVDFRGLDTLGEITVLGVAAIGVYAFLRLGHGRRGDGA